MCILPSRMIDFMHRFCTLAIETHSDLLEVILLYPAYTNLEMTEISIDQQPQAKSLTRFSCPKRALALVSASSAACRPCSASWAAASSHVSTVEQRSAASMRHPSAWSHVGLYGRLSRNCQLCSPCCLTASNSARRTSSFLPVSLPG